MSNRMIKLSLLYGTFIFVSCAITEMGKLKTPQYIQGKATYQGAKSCSECHKEIYDQWKTSRHSMATSDPWFHEMKKGVNLLYYMMMGKDFCYNCHGPKELNEGVSCEICHGVNDIRDTEIIHKEKYTPGLRHLKSGQTCGNCHGMRHPISGDVIVTTQFEWEKSPAGKEGLDCTDCHMKKRSNGLSFHGFTSRYIDSSIYEDDIEIRNVSLEFPNLTFVLENKITGHSLLTGGPEAILQLKVEVKNQKSRVLQTYTEIFKQSGTRSFGMPWGVEADNRLTAGEIRIIHFVLPESLRNRITSMTVSLKLFSVDFRYKGDIKKARWESDKFYEKTFSLTE